MEDNVYRSAAGTVIINGGNPLPGCPNDWDEARLIQGKLNDGKEKDEDSLPYWNFDCGFKLDYDGSLLQISSRFYPPKSHYGSTWDGGVTVYFMGKEVVTKQFDCATLEELKNEVNTYVKSIEEKLSKVVFELNK